jgi:hypothetical protein
MADAMREIPWPLRAEQMLQPDVSLLRLVDQFVLRFTKLQAWALQRGVRNALTHEYPEDPLRLVLALNDAQQKALQLIEWLDLIRARIPHP